jgi:hypothetical protein
MPEFRIGNARVEGGVGRSEYGLEFGKWGTNAAFTWTPRSAVVFVNFAFYSGGKTPHGERLILS